MIKHVVALSFALLAFNASAEVFKCKGSDGKVQFSDTPCSVGHASEIMPDRMPVTDQQRLEAQKRAMQMQSEAGALEEKNQADIRASRQSDVSESPPASDAGDTNAYANCVRDVERHGATQNSKAKLIAACRTAGASQEGKKTSTDTVGECVRSVERTGASEAEKSRQIALCHGGDVRPLYIPVPVQRSGSR